MLLPNAAALPLERLLPAKLARPPSPLLPANLLLPDPRERKSPPGVLCYAATFSLLEPKDLARKRHLSQAQENGMFGAYITSKPCQACLADLALRFCFEVSSFRHHGLPKWGLSRDDSDCLHKESS